MSDNRRKMIIEKLNLSTEPFTGTELATYFEVSRQVIVQDVAILRAEGYSILATSSGYIIPKVHGQNRMIKTFVSEHRGFDRMEEELKIIVEYGGKVIDVIVEHPVYGEIVGTLLISNMDEVNKFIKRVDETNAKPLSLLTDGAHIHTIEVPSEKIFKLIKAELYEKGFIKEL
ncbi:transcription repressor NadR [Fusibacter sp. 3D3]|uniref:transcription repressor NadR n=1 Tax=Fusibacter sp. 3D3 TaxID=1048380 RepID=UPI0008536275|nr:transcription repressor NadR [Fusibacter sp. 3D3]GAU76854.1 transcriptional repressor for NAD biosynthesis in gram-positives [Fusibacter sp. 3D3]